MLYYNKHSHSPLSGNLLLIIFVSYFGTKLHRPIMIGVGCAVMGLGCFLISIPHFLMGR
jgi:solute carrier organic anion transporter family protein 1A